MNRRAILIGAAVTLAHTRAATAQAFKLPSEDVLYHALKTPENTEPVVLGVITLRTLLLLEFTRTTRSGDNAEWFKDREEFTRVLNLIRNPDARAKVSTMIEKRDPQAIAPGVLESALPVVRRYEQTLDAGGLRAGSPLSVDVLSSFLTFHRFQVAFSPDNQRWYCRIFPLSYACG
ncbi:MAG: hypothetical protein K2P86_08020 [Xanthobacteraceae bacterium]|nr:hypothetical protein [Xanthobacteraceae bacterium]